MELLYNSKICRLCGEENTKGTNIFITEETEFDLSVIINRYLPIKIYDDGRYPNWICPACRLQVDTTAQFFDLLVIGQNALREFLKNQYEEEKRLQNKPQSLLKNGFIEPDPEPEYLNDNTLDGSFLFPSDHVIQLKVDGLEKPRKKRGRPPKASPEVLEAQRQEQEALLKSQKLEEIKEVSETDENDGNRKRRKIKIPSRFQEAVQGKELERIYIEKGVIDKVEGISETEDTFDDTKLNENEYRNEIIGHLQGKDGSSLGDLVFVKSSGHYKGKKYNNKKGKTKFICDICDKSFLHEIKFMAHRSSHHNVRFECIECLEPFISRKLLSEHQQATNHQGEGIIESMQEKNDSEEILSLNQNDIFDDNKEENENENDNIDDGVAKLIESLEETNQINDKNDYLTVPNINKDLLTYDRELNTIQEQDENIADEHNIDNNSILDGNPEDASSSLQETSESMTNVNEEIVSIDNNSQYKCNVCPRTFSHPGSLLYHKESKHNNARKFVCSKCDKSFSHRLLLQRHQNVHSSERNFQCNECPAKFKTKTNLKYHLCKHSGEKNYQCEICDQFFSHKTSLTIHFRLHSGEKPFKCETCGKLFNQNGNLQEHIRIHTGERPFKCNYCDKTFTTSSQRKLHISRHLGERKYECETCKKTFLYMETYKTHVRRHKNEKPFVCGICSRAFTDPWSLKKHSRLHTGEKPYNCKLCGKKFSDCSNLTKHKKAHCLFRNKEVVDSFIENEQNNDQSEIIVTNSDPIINDTSLVQSENDVDLKNNQIIYFTYEEQDIDNSNVQIQPDQYMQDINSITTENDENAMVIKNTTDEGQNSMIFSVRKIEENDDVVLNSHNLEVNDANNYSTDILQFTQNGDNVLYQLQGTADEFSEHQTIEYITEDGRKVHLLNYTEPLDLAPEYMEIS